MSHSQARAGSGQQLPARARGSPDCATGSAASMLRPSQAASAGAGAAALPAAPSAQHAKATSAAFAYDARVAHALVPALIVALGSGGTPAFACTAVGALLAYTLDVLRMAEAALAVVWLTLLADYFCMARAEQRPPSRCPLPPAARAD